MKKPLFRRLHWAMLLWALPLGGVAYGLYLLIFGKSGMDENGNYTFSSVATRELRANNPLGVSVSNSVSFDNIDRSKSVPNSKTGVSIPGVDDKLGDKLLIFQTTQDGLNAAAKLLNQNYFGGQYTTIGSIGDQWSGKSAVPPNQFSDYSNGLANIMGRPVDSVLSYGIDGPALMKGLARDENGTPFVLGIPAPMYLRAIAYGVNV